MYHVMSHPANSSTSSTQVVKQQPKMMLDDTMMTAMAVDGDTSNAASAGGGDVRMGTEDDFFFMDDLDSSDDDSSSDDDNDDEGDDDDDDDDDSEASLVHNDDDPAAAAAAFHGAAVAQALQQLVTSRSNGSLKSLGHEPSTERAAARRRGNAPDGRARMQGSSSMANLLQMKMALDQQQQGQQSNNNTTSGNKMHLSVSAGNIGDMAQDDDASTSQEIDESVLKPDDHLATLIGGPGQLFSYDSLEGFFLPVRPEYVQAWTNELTRAIRDHDLTTLQRMHEQGHRLQACNQFGESVVHLTVRRGTPEMLRFLLQDAGVSMRVCCDYGRTPLHDAAWSLASNMGAFEKMELLLRESPMQLYITDKRGFTPLAYVPRNRWKECNAFLDRQYAKGRLFRMGSVASAGSGGAANGTVSN